MSPQGSLAFLFFSFFKTFKSLFFVNGSLDVNYVEKFQDLGDRIYVDYLMEL